MSGITQRKVPASKEPLDFQALATTVSCHNAELHVEVERLKAELDNWRREAHAQAHLPAEVERLKADLAASDAEQAASDADVEALMHERDQLRDRIAIDEKRFGGFEVELCEVQQILGKALGYPWYKDDQKNFPGATEADGVVIGPDTAESLAEMAAEEIARLRARVAELEQELQANAAMLARQTDMARQAEIERARPLPASLD